MNSRLYRVAAMGVAAFPTALQAETIHIEMANLGYKPTSVAAQVGDIIEWTNADFVAHTATARDKAWDVSVMPKKTGTITLKKKGEVDYYCRFHPNMVGHITVAE